MSYNQVLTGRPAIGTQRALATKGAGEDKFMSATPAPQRIELSPAVRAILEADTPKSQLLRHFLSFTEAIITPDPAGIDRVVSPDVRFHELEAIGYPRGPEGFKVFRRQVNAAIPDEHISVINVRFAGDDIIEADLDISATHTGEEFMGIPATGRKIRPRSAHQVDRSCYQVRRHQPCAWPGITCWNSGCPGQFR
jgi:predicted ester cyclase